MIVKSMYRLEKIARLNHSKYITSRKVWSSARKGLLGLLTDDQRVLLKEQHRLSHETLVLAKRIGIDTSDKQYASSFLQHILTPTNDTSLSAQSDRAQSEDLKDTTFSIVVAGEFNAGKSTLINALLGEKLLETGPLPTTEAITVVTGSSSSLSSESSHQQGDYKDMETRDNHFITTTPTTTTKATTTDHTNAIVLHRVNSPFLNDITFIDTPGTNALNNHTARTMKLLPSADLILFITSADRPFPESERKLLQAIQSYRKNIVIVINKMDHLDASGGVHGDVMKQKVKDFVSANAAEFLGANPMIISVSAKDALTAKLIHGLEGEESLLWKKSNFQLLEDFLRNTLTEETKIEAKLLNPLGVTEGMLSECHDVLMRRKKGIETDTATLKLLEATMKTWKGDMTKDIKDFTRIIGSMMDEEKIRGKLFLEGLSMADKIKMLSITGFDEIDKKWDRTKSLTITNNIKEEVSRNVKEHTEQIATSCRSQGQAVLEYLGTRPASIGKNIYGSVTAAVRFDEKQLRERMLHASTNVLSYDDESEKNHMLSSLRSSIVVSSASGIIAVVLGTATSFHYIDLLPGYTSVFLFSIFGAVTVPLKSRSLIAHHEERWNERYTQLVGSLESILEKEVEKMHKRILDSIKPYIRFVETEEQELTGLGQQHEGLVNSTQMLRSRVNKLK